MSDKVIVPESHRDLLDVQTGAFATIGGNGLPQVTAIWFYYDEAAGLLKLWLLDKRQKARNLRANPNVTLFVMDPKNAFRTIEVRCRAEVAADPEFTAMKGIAAKYDVTDFGIFDEPGDTRSAIFLHPLQVVVLDQPPIGWDSVVPR
jgi:PPOX class probable F420-dependent enzyme